MIKVVLFDVDGTLIKAGKAPRKAFERAILEVWGKHVSLDNVSFLGMTDISILKKILEKNRLHLQKDLEEKFWTKYPVFLKKYIKEERDKKLLPGITEILKTLKDIEIELGLLTGNIKKGAKIKLETFNLWHYFSFGAFGDEKEKREDLVPLAMKRAEKILGEKLKIENFLIVGDSIPDILCGKKHGIRTVIVGTGWEKEENLLKHSPFLYIQNFIEGKEKFLSLFKLRDYQ